MRTILDFLLDSSFQEEVGSAEEINSLSLGNSFQGFKKMFDSSPPVGKQHQHFTIRPRIQENQLWTVKKHYDDFQGVSRENSHPIIVCINQRPSDLEDEAYVRVNVVSPFIEFASTKDEVCEDPSIIGFPFLIERWNDQPVLCELLDEYIGYYEAKTNIKSALKRTGTINTSDLETLTAETEDLSEEQKAFRSIELSRARYINHSIFSLIKFLENRQFEDMGVLVSMSNEHFYPKLVPEGNDTEPDFALAARSVVEGKEKSLALVESNLPFKLLIRKRPSGFVVSVLSNDKIRLLSNDGSELQGISVPGRTVFEEIRSGLYKILAQSIDEPIKIRLK